MTTIYVALDDGLLVARGASGRWQSESRFEGMTPLCLAADPARPERVWCGIIGAGAWRSDDAGASWGRTGEDMATLDVSAVAVGPDEAVVYAGIDPSAIWRSEDAGRSWEGGGTWERPDAGIERHYLYGLAVDPGDPDTVVVSAAASPMEAHSREVADSTVYRRSGEGPWREVFEGLPEPKGSLRALLAANVDERGVFYAVSNRGVFRSADGGAS